MKKKWLKISNVFFIVAFTVAIFSFSLGSSVLNSYQKRLDRYDTDKNKLIAFDKIDEYTLERMTNLLANEDITITLQNSISTNEDNSYVVSTIIKDDGIKTLPDLKDGEYLSKDDYGSSNNMGVFSAGLTTEEVFNIKDNTPFGVKEYSITKKGTTYTARKEIYIPNSLFFDLVSEKNIALNRVLIIFSGEKEKIEKAIEMISKDVKSINGEANIIVDNYYIDNRTYEGDMLIKSSILIVIITLLNSICISKLWVKGKCKEIVLRLVCGAKRKDIFKLFYGELLILSLISFAIAILGQVILVQITSGFILNMDIRITLWNLLLSIILSIVVALLSAIPSIKYISKIQPIEFLREE